MGNAALGARGFWNWRGVEFRWYQAAIEEMEKKILSAGSRIREWESGESGVERCRRHLHHHHVQAEVEGEG
jgi:hypothetical protein